jgi:hypothetical protein
MKAPVLYMVKVWVAPEEGKQYLDWLHGGHISEVVRESEFLWARQYQLEGFDESGWTAHIIFFGVDTLDSLKRYFDSPSRERFVRETERFKGLFRAERFYGPVDFDLALTVNSGEEDAKAIYCVKFAVTPKSHQSIIEWLDEKHIPEAINELGFLWVRRVHLDAHDADDWERYLMIYGQSKSETLKEFFEKPLRLGFFHGWESLLNELRLEKFFGTIEFVLDRA